MESSIISFFLFICQCHSSHKESWNVEVRSDDMWSTDNHVHIDYRESFVVDVAAVPINFLFMLSFSSN